MGVFLARRPALLPFQAVGVVTIVFVLVHLLPGNPAYLIAGPQATASQVRAISAELGLMRPLPVQYVDYLANVAHGNLGVSWYTSYPVRTDFAQRAPATLELITLALLGIIVLGIVLAGVIALNPRGIGGRLVSIYGFATGALPDFWVGLALIFVFYYKIGAVSSPSGQLSSHRRLARRKRPGFRRRDQSPAPPCDHPDLRLRWAGDPRDRIGGVQEPAQRLCRVRRGLRDRAVAAGLLRPAARDAHVRHGPRLHLRLPPGRRRARGDGLFLGWADAQRPYGISLCNHGQADGTISSEVIEPRAARLWWTYGWPCGAGRGYETLARVAWGRYVAFDVAKVTADGEVTRLDGQITPLGV
jgi:hypothetical protein